MKQLTDLDEMPFGKYAARFTKVPMQDVPASYLHWLWTNGKDQETKTCPVADYIERNLNALKKEYPNGIW
jgi:hypothetical protein